VTIAKLKFNRATAKVNEAQEQVDRDKKERGKALKNVMAALDDGHVANAISSGEQHEQADKVISNSMKMKEDAEHEARVWLTHIQHAKAREAQALHLQTLASREYNQAASNDRILEEQVQKLQKLKTEQDVRKAHANEILSKADQRIRDAQEAYRQAQQTLKARIRVTRYLQDVKLKVAERLTMGSKGALKASAAAVGEDGGDELAVQRRLTVVKAAVQSLSTRAEQVAQSVQHGEAEVSQAKSKISSLATKIISAENTLQMHKDETQIKVAKAKVKLMEAKHPVVQLKPKEAESETQNTAAANIKASVHNAKEVAKRMQEINDETKLKALDDASDELEKAKKVYHNAFGSSKAVPGHDEAAKAISKARHVSKSP